MIIRVVSANAKSARERSNKVVDIRHCVDRRLNDSAGLRELPLVSSVASGCSSLSHWGTSPFTGRVSRHVCRIVSKQCWTGALIYTFPLITKSEYNP